MVANFDTSMLLFFTLTTAHLLRGWGDDHVPSAEAHEEKPGG